MTSLVMRAATMLALADLAAAAHAEDFYADKTITLTTYGAPGDSYDLYSRLLARHMGRHIAGAPHFIVINEPGGGGLRAINHAGVTAPHDGTFITLASQALLILEATGQPGLQASLDRFNWLGSFTQSNNVTVTWFTSPIRTLADAMAHETVVGATGSGGGSSVGPLIYNAVIGTKFKLVYGYEGGVNIDLAMERGEVDGRGNNTWAGYKATAAAAIRDHKLNVLIQTGLRKEKDLPDVPFFLDLVRGDPAREPIARFMSYAVSIARPLAAPPDVPAERVQALRRAFDATMRDPEFLADAERLAAEIDPLSGEQVQDVVHTVLTTPRPVINQIQKTLALPVH